MTEKKSITEIQFEGMAWPTYHCGLCAHIRKTKNVPPEDLYEGKGKYQGYCYSFVKRGLAKKPNPIEKLNEQLCGSFVEC